MISSAIITTVCVVKLVKVGLKLNTFSYGNVMELAFGRNGRIILELMIALTQFSFSISQVSFMARSLKQLWTPHLRLIQISLYTEQF